MLELVLEVVGVVLSVALVVIMFMVGSVQVEAHNLLGEVLTTHLTLSPDRN